jgi:hypothetical protein
MRHNCTVPSLSAVTAPLTSHQPLSPMDASPAPPSPPSPSSPVRRTPARMLIIIDCDPEDLGRVAAPIGLPTEPALRRPSLYAMMHAHAPTRASTAAAAAEGGPAADLLTGRFEPPLPLRFDPLLPIGPRRLAEINAGAPGGSRETATVVHPSQRRRVELSRFTPYPQPSSGVRIEPMAPPLLPAIAPSPVPSPATTRSPVTANPPPRRHQFFLPPLR